MLSSKPRPAVALARAACPPSRPHAPDGQPHLRVAGLGLQRSGKWLFRDMSWDVPRGKFVAVVGPSGVGKSSLLACLSGMLQPDEGSVTYCCSHGCLHDPSNFQQRIGIIFQNLMLVKNHSVLTNVLCGRLGRYPWWQTLFGFGREDREEAIAILRDLGLGCYLRRWVAEVSGGEQQRTAIARALFQQPEIFLADEPVSNLDTYLTGRVLGLLKQEASLHGRTVFCVLHNADLVDRFADYALSIDPMRPEGWKIREIRHRPSGASL
jgi:phosphonate transport system ATP-binding protein